MIESTMQVNRRILIIDDNRAIHDDFRKILCTKVPENSLDEDEALLFGPDPSAPRADWEREFELDSAYQGEDGLELVRRALAEGRPYAMAFIDVRMPPGWDGVETAARIWREYPELEIVICTAYSDYSWEDMLARLEQTDRLLILKKPFDNVEVGQLASSLTAKWGLARKANHKMHELERTVEARTRELRLQKSDLEETLSTLQRTQSQLLQADKLASIGQLAAGVAHEINNPMGYISSNLNSLGRYIEDIKSVLVAFDGLLVEGEKSGELAAACTEVRRICQERDLDYLLSDIGSLIEESVEGAGRVRQIVADLRDFSHVNNPEATEEDVNDLLDKTINVAWNELKYKTEVVRDYGDIPAIRCYGGKLAQVFLNLLVNAAQAIKERGTITVRTRREDENIRIEVADTGCGMPQENLRRIFDPFFTTKEVGSGTGLGLHLAYTTIQAHGGRIDVESAPGEGTTFRIELPVAGPPSTKEEQYECAV